jgi:hypothetical protein
MDPQPRLSKSKALAGWQCHKKLWLEVYEPERAVSDPSLERVFAIGHEVGELARRLFPGGVLIGHDERLDDALAETGRRLAGDGPVTLFEATFRHDDVLVRVDVLERDAAGRHRLVEVKAGTRVKPVHYIDCAVQAWVLTGCGLPPDRVELAHVDNGFVYPGGGDYTGLLTFADLTSQTREAMGSVPRWLAEYRSVLAGPMPDIAIGPQCSTPYPCPFLGFCTPPQPDYPVRRLPGRGKVVWELLEAGIEDLRDVPAGRLTSDVQEWVRRVTLEGHAELKPEAAERLAGLGWPRYYFDFETVAFAVPIWEGTRPYEALPFQWSCHVEHEDGRLEHREWLADGSGPPMKECAETLLAALGDAGPIFTYTDYEARVLRNLGARFPSLAESLAAIAARLFDLHPLTRQCYYHPDMRGSWSIKAVLPTLDGDMAYDRLGDIREGASASDAFLELMRGDLDAEQRAALRSALLEYCGYDTLALVRLAETLRGDREPRPVLTPTAPDRRNDP